MPNWYKIRGSTLSAIANAIRSKTGNEDDPMTPLEMPEEIESIGTSGVVVSDGIVVKSKTSNGYPVSIDVYGDAWAYMFGKDWNSTYSGSELTDVTLKEQGTTLRASAFSGCTKLASINNENIVRIDTNALNFTSLSNGEFPNVESVGGTPLRGVSTITDLKFPKLKNCGIESLFHSMTNLQTIQLGSVGYGVTSVRYDIMYACSFAGTLTCYCAGDKVDTFLPHFRNYGGANCTIVLKASEETTYGGTTYQAGDTILTSVPESAS